ncbi:MAG: alkaline phosphatase D [Candidatus Latescibacterota bacterium]|jgi:alkaline phosphatase D
MFKTCGLVLLSFLFATANTHAQLTHGQGEMAGEVTQTSVILQSRLTKGTTLVNGDLPGHAGWAQFEVSRNADLSLALVTGWQEAFDQDDYIIKAQVDLLERDTQYYYRLVFGANTKNVTRGNIRSFRTLPKADVIKPMRLVIVTGMNYHKFHKGPNAYQGKDKDQGYPALEAITNLKPNFFIATGDNVYYDQPQKTTAKTIKQMRQKWHQQFAQPRFARLFESVATYWQKDDHDYRYDDADATGSRLPSHKNGIAIFKEQVPITDPLRKDGLTYRTYRLGKLVQIWLTEGRDYRSPNTMPDGPDKTLWGEKQKEWLKRTLSESDAPFKFLISPTPLIGPDENRKIDNHANLKGFRYEGDTFFTWLYRNGFYNKNFYILCGDRHWQYHSIHPSGFEEFSSGALVDANARMGINPGDHQSTDPNRLINQKFTNKEPTGGFLMVDVTPSDNGTTTAAIIFYDEKGTELYRVEKTAQIK